MRSQISRAHNTLVFYRSKVQSQKQNYIHTHTHTHRTKNTLTTTHDGNKREKGEITPTDRVTLSNHTNPQCHRHTGRFDGTSQ